MRWKGEERKEQGNNFFILLRVKFTQSKKKNIYYIYKIERKIQIYYMKIAILIKFMWGKWTMFQNRKSIATI